MIAILVLLGLAVVAALWAVGSYNNRREVFPASLVAGMFNFAPAALLEIADRARREAPKVSF
jgi:LemA protein